MTQDDAPQVAYEAARGRLVAYLKREFKKHRADSETGTPATLKARALRDIARQLREVAGLLEFGPASSEMEDQVDGAEGAEPGSLKAHVQEILKLADVAAQVASTLRSPMAREPRPRRVESGDGQAEAADNWAAFSHDYGDGESAQPDAVLRGAEAPPKARSPLPGAALLFLHVWFRCGRPRPTMYDLDPATLELKAVLEKAGSGRSVQTVRAHLSAALKQFDRDIPPPGWDAIF